MKRTCSRVLAVLAIATAGTVLQTNCTIGNPPDNPDCLFFCDRSSETSQTAVVTDAPLSVSQPVAGQPA